MAEDDSDLDIEELIKGLDLGDNPKKPTPTPTVIPPPPQKSNLKDPNTMAIKEVNKPFDNDPISKQTSQAKSVRFSYDIQDSSGPVNQKNPSSMLNNMFFPEEDKSINAPQAKIQQQDNPSKQSEAIQQPLGKKVEQNNDWLGLDDSKPESSKMTSTNFKTTTGPPTGPLTAPNNPTKIVSKSSGVSASVPQSRSSQDSFDGQDLLQLLDTKINGPSPHVRSRSMENREEPVLRKPPLPPSETAKNLKRGEPGFYMTPPGTRSVSPSTQFNLGRTPEKSNEFKSNIYPGIHHQSPEGGSLSSLNLLQENSKPVQTFPASSSILDSLPFLKQKAQGTTAMAGDNYQNQSQAPAVPQGQGSVKKKGSISKVAVNSPANTLQLPSHLVNEEELKTMSSSLKTLYGNQLEMLETSYKEQMEFLSLSNKRKEDLLKEEMSGLQGDYDQRIQRLRTELIENETRHPKKANEEISNLSAHFEKLSAQLEMLKTSLEFQSKKEINFETLGPGLSKELDRLLDNKLTNVSQTIQTSLMKEIRHTLETSTSQSISDQSDQLKELKVKLDDVVGATGQNSELVLSKLNETEKTRQVEFEKLIRIQNKIKEKAINSTMSSINKIFETTKEEDLRKRDRLAFQVKEFRKDLRRLYAELENKNDSVHKSQLSMELEQRSITQAIRDINTLFKVTSVKQDSFSSNEMLNQLTSRQAVHQQSQNEMEIRLLRDERNALSESIAELNVQKRKLTDEKLNFERDKMELEREKVRVREIEMRSKARLAEAEDLKGDAESVRLHETKISGEAQHKLDVMGKERSKMKERIFEIEQKLVMREQRLFQEKSELMREKMFVDKLRDQLLCPGCLNSVKGVSSLAHMAPPPYFHQLRSEGDGVDVGIRGDGGGNIGRMFQQISRMNLTPTEEAYFRKESSYLDDLSTKDFTDL